MLRRTVGGAAASSASLAGSSSSVGRIDDDVGAGELAELAHLDRRPRCLHRPPPAHDEDLPNPRADERLDRRVGRIGRLELLAREREHARDVEGDVAVPDHDGPLVREVEREALEVGVAVVPGDELGGGEGAGQILARNPEPAIRLRADRVDDGVVQPGKLLVETSRPTSTLPKKRKPGCCAVFSNARETALIFG